MKNTLLLMGIVFGWMVAVLPAQAQDDGTSGEAVESAQPTEAGNKICPVSGEKVGEMGEPFKIEYNGVIYNLCCKMCVADFNKDPEKYIEKIKKQMEEAAAE